MGWKASQRIPDSAGILHVGRAAALTLLAIACTLTITVVNNLVFFHKSETARTVYGARDIDVTLAGMASLTCEDHIVACRDVVKECRHSLGSYTCRPQ